MNGALFDNILISERQETMIALFNRLNGCYYAYFYWKSMERPQDMIMMKSLIEIYNYNPSSNTLLVRALTDSIDLLSEQHERGWDYEGHLIAYEEKLTFIFQNAVYSDSPKLVWIIANKPARRFKDINGIISAYTRKAGMINSMPAASRILMRKINGPADIAELERSVAEELAPITSAKTIQK